MVFSVTLRTRKFHKPLHAFFVFVCICSLQLSRKLVSEDFSASELHSAHRKVPRLQATHSLSLRHPVEVNTERAHLYPFTQYGADDQLLGTIQAFSLCKILSISCMEPSFPHHLIDTAYTFPVPFSDIFDVPSMPSTLILPRTSNRVQFDFIITTNIQSDPCWPDRKYWDSHGIDYMPYDNLSERIVMLNRTRKSRLQMEHALIETVHNLVSEKGQTQNITIGYIYCDLFGRPNPESPLLLHAYKNLSRTVVPSVAHQLHASAVMQELNLTSQKFAAVHLHLKDDKLCMKSFAYCCCVGQRSNVNITELGLRSFFRSIVADLHLDAIYLTSQPAIQNITKQWPWLKETGVKMWFASKETGTFEEAMVQRLISSRAYVFVRSADGTWSDTVRNWGSNGLLHASLIVNTLNFGAEHITVLYDDEVQV